MGMIFLKRLIKKAFGHRLYHATSMELFKLIIQSGIIMPQGGYSYAQDKEVIVDQHFKGNEKEYEEYYKNYDGFTFFGTDDYIVKEYGYDAAVKSGFSEMYAIIEVDLPEESLLPDLNDMPS